MRKEIFCHQWGGQEFLSSGRLADQTILRSGQLWAIVTISKNSCAINFGVVDNCPTTSYATVIHNGLFKNNLFMTTESILFKK
jgi:hypothetical protein